jgi:hypothetical protein
MKFTAMAHFNHTRRNTNLSHGKETIAPKSNVSTLKTSPQPYPQSYAILNVQKNLIWSTT